MKMLNNKEEVISQILVRSGWFSGRNVGSSMEEIPLFTLLPNKIKKFLSEFGGLKIKNDNAFDEINIIGVDFLIDQLNYDYYKENIYNSSESININNENDEYYYSVLLGKQIFYVASLKEDNYLMMDEDENFYVHTFIPEFFWIANESIDAIEQIIFGFDNAKILNEKTLKWGVSRNKNLFYDPPINNKLVRNPWFS